ncbi:unnamed protein product, partial [Choristocarpus tenellus]
LDDIERALILLSTLRAHGAIKLFRDLFVVVPDRDKFAIDTIFSGLNNVRVIAESVVFPPGTQLDPTWEGYAIQMAIKLYAASLMSTEFYLTLDADVLCTKRGISLEDLLPSRRANYINEGKHVHPAWWKSSTRLLRAKEQEPIAETGGFGVTPAILST